jgi:hypothetical protein
MLIHFIYDTYSFSDILIQLTIVSSTTEFALEEGHESTTKRTNDDTNKKGKGDKPEGKWVHLRHFSVGSQQIAGRFKV